MCGWIIHTWLAMGDVGVSWDSGECALPDLFWYSSAFSRARDRFMF